MNNGNCIFQSAANGGTQLIALAGAEAGGGGGEQCQVNFMLHNFIDFLRVSERRKGESERVGERVPGDWAIGKHSKSCIWQLFFIGEHTHTHTHSVYKHFPTLCVVSLLLLCIIIMIIVIVFAF